LNISKDFVSFLHKVELQKKKKKKKLNRFENKIISAKVAKVL
jgi:hypothetical protein